MKLPYSWLTELVNVPAGVDEVASALALRGFEVASIDDGVIDFEITANRPDCLSVIGLAREASAAYSVPLGIPERHALSAADGAQPLEVTIEDAELCPRYCAQMFELQGGATPDWMRERLEACGVRSISPVVDVTNYVMLEMGQPTHAFDYAKLAGHALRIRRATPRETIRTLDAVERALDPEMLVIADADRAQAIGGVMGGADSEIGGATKLMVLESAFFKPASVRRTSRRLALKTEASTRFERGADIDAAPAAIARAGALLHQIGAARPVGPTIDRYPSPRPVLSLWLRAGRIERVLGVRVPPGTVPQILSPLGFTVLEQGSEKDGTPAWPVLVPRFRVDVQREIDLIEEIARNDGYKGLPATFPELTAPQAPPDPRSLRDRLLRQLLTSCGLSEAVTFSFIEAAAAQPFAATEHTDTKAADYTGPTDTKAAEYTERTDTKAAEYTEHTDTKATDHTEHTDTKAAEYTEHAKRAEKDRAVRGLRGGLVRVANPLSEKFAVMRPSLLPGLVDAAAHNRRRQHEHVRLFETGARFRPAIETRSVAGVWCGAGAVPHWSGASQAADFYDVKGVVETICRAFGVEADFRPADVPYLVRGRSAEIFRVKDPLGVIGQIAPAIAEARGFPSGETLWAFELDVDALAGKGGVDDLRAEPLPRFPSIVRDLSVLVDAALPAASVRGTIRTAAPATLTHVIEFDRYRGKGVPEGRVSLSLRLTFRSADRTLTDVEVDGAERQIMAALAARHGAVRR